jgi:large subunit ribosomal protein L1
LYFGHFSFKILLSNLLTYAVLKSLSFPICLVKRARIDSLYFPRDKEKEEKKNWKSSVLQSSQSVNAFLLKLTVITIARLAIMTLPLASSSVLSTTIHGTQCCFASTSRRLLSTSPIVLGKSPPGKGKNAILKARREARMGGKQAAEKNTSKKDSQIMNLSDAVKLFQSVEVARPSNAYELHICTNIDSHLTNALRGRLALPKEARTKAEKLLIFAEDGSDSVNLVQTMLENDPSLKNVITVGGAEFINDVAAGTGAASGLQFTKVLCTQALLPQLSRSMARSLGPRGLMPSLKRGTVVTNGDEMRIAIREAQGALDWRGDRNGVVRGAVGRIHFTESELRSNIAAFLHGIVDKIQAGLTSGQSQTGVATPSSVVGNLSSQDMKRAMTIIKQIHLSSTQGPAVLLPHSEVM